MRKNNFLENLLTMEELISALKNQYSKHTIYKWVQKDGMPHCKLRGKLWFPKNDVLQWLCKEEL